MGRIQVLSDRLIDRISAGEVVERPASVVKELVENSLDSGATAIEVELEGGGRQSIRVVDDGHGMDRDDALLALERHATSKIRQAEDLDAIGTFGFRGEALASIAAVSILTLGTSCRDGDGTLVQARGGTIQSVRDTGLPRGTSLRVERLFFNVPARRKFLRAETTELAHVTRWLVRCALVRPGLRLHLRHGARPLLDAPPVADAAARIAQLHGPGTLARLLRFDAGGAGVRVHGFAGRPAEAEARRDGQHLFVNGRVVQDRLLAHAVRQAYGNTLASGRHPLLFLFLEVDPASVDVNVHPQKMEVRFRETGRVHDLVEAAVRHALSRSAAVPSLADLRPAGIETTAPEPWGATPSAGVVAEPRQAFVSEPRISGAIGPPAREPEVAREPAPGLAAERIVPLAQLRESYILAEDSQGLVVVDQHAAHERVLFERYLDDAQADQVQVQRLLFPALVELSAAERVHLESEAGEFRRLGFEIEPFGTAGARVDGVPALAASIDVDRLLRDLVGQVSHARSAASDSPELRRRLVTTAACRAAITINHRLSALEMQRLLDDLYATGNPTTCPHGRPVLFRLTLTEIERSFRRR